MAIVDAAKPNEVTSKGRLDVFLGYPRARLLILSGIAQLNWGVDVESGDEFERGTLTVLLREKVKILLQSTVTVGIANISADESDWLYAIEDVNVRINKDSELEIFCHVDGK